MAELRRKADSRASPATSLFAPHFHIEGFRARLEHMMETARHKGLVLGVTGAAGSGKSSVTKMLASLGAQTADADALVRWAYSQPDFAGALVKRFGNGILNRQGAIDRLALAAIVFQNADALADLERLVHPAVLEQMANTIEAYRADAERAPVLALEIPLLYEAGAESMVDRVLTVTASLKTRSARLARRGWDAERISAVEKSQMPLAEKEARADYVVSAEGTLAETGRRVETLWRALTASSNGGF